MRRAFMGYTVACLILLIGQRAGAGEAKVLVIMDVDVEEGAASGKDAQVLTESLYTAATRFPPTRFSVVSSERLHQVLSDQGKLGDEPLFGDAVGALVGADLVLTGVVVQTPEGTLKVTLKLHEVGTGRLLGLEHARGTDAQALAEALRETAGNMLAVLAEGAAPAAVESPLEEKKAEAEAEAPVREFLVQFQTVPREARVHMDGREICEETPCSYRVEEGRHTFRVEAELHEPEEHIVKIDGKKELRFELVKRKYSYLGMNDAKLGGWLVTLGMSPLDTEYRQITTLDGVFFAGLHPIVDVGFAGDVFGYRSSSRGQSWSIFSMGPAFRFGRAILTARIQLLSFRHKSELHGEGWLPGLNARFYFPLVNRREAGLWSHLVPTPMVGVDVWLKDLDHDQTQFVVGFAWPGTVRFK